MKARIILSFTCIALLAGCFKPWKGFDEHVAPQEPDYSKKEAWIALPWMHSEADTVPPGSGLKNEQATAQVDVFFIYPTLDFRTDEWNADIQNESLNKRIENTSIRGQASVFNGSCRIFAPRYRQAILSSFVDKNGDGQKALNLAYSDVRKAFLYYMKNYNKGRPVIIAGHSQGGLHAYKLIKEFFDTTALKQQLVAAYLIGTHVFKDSLKTLKPCDSATQTGCYISWNTVKWGGLSGRMGEYFKGVCINPLSWKEDSNYVDAVYNTGSVNYKFNGVTEHEMGAACRNGALWINSPKSSGYFPLFGSYHIYDYSFFYMNIRTNVADRVKAYIANH
ncbi:MAG TPA: DUF3089 domain-containing protein [Bacteroidia bacterium]|nr:DUF3089 domain-containing protein [Bacteroidia bacterium]